MPEQSIPADQIRQRILDEAIRLFAEHGIEGLSMRKLAAEIGYTQTVIYRHFDDKDDLVSSIVDHGFALLYAELPPLDDDDPTVVLRAIADHYLAFGLDHPDLYALMFARRPKGLFVVGDDPVKLERVQLLERAGRELAPLAERFAIDPSALADALWAHVHGLLALYEVHPEWTRERVLAAHEALRTLAIGIALAP